MTAEHWRLAGPDRAEPKADAVFMTREGFPQGALILKAGGVALDGLNFRNGTIEFDVKPIGEDMPGIRFRQRGAPGVQDAEEFYVRNFSECRASDDCVQYAPVIHGFMLWNVYPQFQSQAFVVEGWNHVRLVISGRRMKVYVNRFPGPVLTVGNLESESAEGEIQLEGPAVFANVVITPDAVDGLPEQPLPDPTAGDHGIIRRWQLGPLEPLRFGKTPSYEAMPTDPQLWKSMATERLGLLNLNRQYRAADVPPALGWLRYTVESDREQRKRVSMGWIGQVWIFENGRLITEGKNFYDPERERRAPDGRLAMENGSFDVPLRKGRNEIAIALYGSPHDDARNRTPYGWGLMMRFADPEGLRLP